HLLLALRQSVHRRTGLLLRPRRARPLPPPLRVIDGALAPPAARRRDARGALRGRGPGPGRPGAAAPRLLRPGVGRPLPRLPPRGAAGQDAERAAGPPADLCERRGPGGAVRPLPRAAQAGAGDQVTV